MHQCQRFSFAHAVSCPWNCVKASFLYTYWLLFVKRDSHDGEISSFWPTEPTHMTSFKFCPSAESTRGCFRKKKCYRMFSLGSSDLRRQWNLFLELRFSVVGRLRLGCESGFFNAVRSTRVEVTSAAAGEVRLHVWGRCGRSRARVSRHVPFESRLGSSAPSRTI